MREIVLLIGSDGNEVIKRMHHRLWLEHLVAEMFDKKKIKEEDYLKLGEMITSPDYENVILAESLIEQFKKRTNEQD